MNRIPRIVTITRIMLTLLIGAVHICAQGTAFTYLGRLSDNSSPATGNYELRFAIFDALTAGIAMHAPITNAPVAVSNGLFTATLDFGAGPFNGAARWLEIGVRTNGISDDFTTLTPRQPVMPTPYALFAGKAASLAENANQAFTGLVLYQLDGNDQPLTVDVLALSNRGIQVNAISTGETNDIFHVRVNQIDDGFFGRIAYARVGSAQYSIPRISHVGVRGISAAHTDSHNLRGSVTLSGAMRSKPVTFSTAEADASYYVVASVSATTGTPAMEATRVRISGKTSTGFTAHLEAEPGDGNSVTADWVLIR